MGNCPLTGRPCNKPRPFHITELQGDEFVTLDLCEDCLSAYVGHGNDMKVEQAKSTKGLLKKTENPPSEIEKMLGELFQFILSGIKGKPIPLSTKPPCPKCGLAYDEIVKIGKVGCAECWDHFKEELDAVIKRVQGGNTHTGKVPKKWKEQQSKETKNQIPIPFRIKILEGLMEKTITEEKYEQAAKLRDTIKLLNGYNDRFLDLKSRLEEAVLKEKSTDKIQQEMADLLEEVSKLDGP